MKDNKHSYASKLALLTVDRRYVCNSSVPYTGNHSCINVCQRCLDILVILSIDF